MLLTYVHQKKKKNVMGTSKGHTDFIEGLFWKKFPLVLSPLLIKLIKYKLDRKDGGGGGYCDVCMYPSVFTVNDMKKRIHYSQPLHALTL